MKPTAKALAKKILAEGRLRVTAEGKILGSRGQEVGHSRGDGVRSIRLYHPEFYLEGRKNHSVAVTSHELVWLALKGDLPDGVFVGHKDGNVNNNHPDNLELYGWVLLRKGETA